MLVSIETLFILLAIYQVKHFLCDFPFQTRYMLLKVSHGVEWVLPLTLHCLVHSALTLAICFYFRPEMWWLALVDFVAHFLMDRLKASPHLLGRFKDTKSKAYWLSLGFDQMIHHLTHLYIVWRLVMPLDVSI